MLLRTRISLLVILAFVVICVVLALASLKREELIEEQYSGATIADRATLWRKITASLVQRMADKAWIAAEDEELRKAVHTGDRVAIQRLGAAIVGKLRDQGLADRFDVLNADGTLAYSSRSSVFQTPIITAEVARQVALEGVRVHGVGNDQDRNIAVTLGFPLNAPTGSVGVAGTAVYATGIGEAIQEMEQATQSSVLIVNRRGRLLAGTKDALWDEIGNLIDLSGVDSLQTIEANERFYAAVVLPEKAELGSLVARLISIKDVTDLAHQQKRVSQFTIGAMVAFLTFVLIGLGYYMSRSFAPLTDGVGVLNALSRGDLQARIEGTGGRKDEVGRIAGAVNVFRANLIAFDRFRRSRERQRRRQERFIRREMTELADTLDKDERDAVLTELGQLEHVARDSSSNEGIVLSIADQADGASTDLTRELDSLAMTALAFHKMSDRVQDQNQRLREALATKSAFIALQKELDIAARVQLSLLPKTMPLSDTVEMTGIMRPAKEVGGDFYDYFHLDEHHIGVVVADVSGKGVPAGLFMVMARTMIRATARRYVEKPGQVLATVNDFLEQNNTEELFVTVFYGVLDDRNGRFVYANGGHNPPILVDRADACPLATTGGVALGMFDGLDYSDAYVDMGSGTRLVLFSDGVTEAFNDADEAFGDDRLLDTTRTLPRKQGPDKDVTDIVSAVDTFAGDADQFDDITCVVLVYKGTHSEFVTSSGTDEVVG